MDKLTAIARRIAPLLAIVAFVAIEAAPRLR